MVLPAHQMQTISPKWLKRSYHPGQRFSPRPQKSVDAPPHPRLGEQKMLPTENASLDIAAKVI